MQLKLKFQNTFDEVKTLAQVPTSRRGTNITLEKKYEEIYNKLIDNILTQIDVRFRALNEIQFVQLLDNKLFEFFKKNFPQHLLQNLESSYGNFFDLNKLKNELITLYSSEKFQSNHIQTILKSLFELDLTEVFSEVIKLSKLILTLPSSTATVERSFSALKRIKTYCRNSMLEERLSNLGIISIEKELLRSIKSQDSFYDKVIDIFIKKTRRLDLIYK